jgi:hypothetical protein
VRVAAGRARLRGLLFLGRCLVFVAFECFGVFGVLAFLVFFCVREVDAGVYKKEARRASEEQCLFHLM